jgi:hypothetical protein
MGTVFSPESLSLTLDHIQQDLDLSFLTSREEQGNMVIGMAAGFGVPVFAGYVIQALRGTSLLVGAFSAMPMWRCFDPLPILSGDDEDENMRPESDDDEENVKNLLGSNQEDSGR